MLLIVKRDVNQQLLIIFFCDNRIFQKSLETCLNVWSEQGQYTIICLLPNCSIRICWHGWLARWRKWKSCDVGEAKGLENELWRRWSNGCSFSKLSVTSTTSQLILNLQAFRHFTYVTVHSPTLPSLYLRHTSFSKPSIASPTSHFILQPFRFSYLTSSSLNSPGEPPMKGCIVTKKPLLGTVNKQKRLQWAKLHENWKVDQWKIVLVTDESKFELFGSKHRQLVRRVKGEVMAPQRISPTVKHGGGSVLAWGCFGDDKTGDSVKI